MTLDLPENLRLRPVRADATTIPPAIHAGMRALRAAAGAIRLSIPVATSNPARRPYARLGFEPASAVGVYILMEWPADSVSAPDRENTHEPA